MTSRNGPAQPSPYPWNPYRASSRPERPAWWQRWWVIVPALLLCFPVGLVGLWRRPGVGLGQRLLVTALVLGTFTAIGLSDADGPDPAPQAAAAEDTPSAVPEPEGETTAAPSPELPAEPVAVETPAVVEMLVPDLVGLSPQAALDQLTSVELVAGRIAREPSGQPVGTVLAQSVEPGAAVAPGTAVDVTVAAPYPVVAAVVGDGRSAAVRALRRAGFEVRVRTERRTSGRDGAVLRQVPAARQPLAPGSVVTLVVARVVAPPPPRPPAQSCTEGYDPCLPPASDYDCAGGSGDGPEYAVGPVGVTGYDPYDLDSDGDGVACES